MNGVPVFPFKPEHGHFLFFVDPAYLDRPALWGKVKCRKLDKWIMYDPGTGGTHIFDHRTGELKERNGRTLTLAWIGEPSEFSMLTRAEQLSKALSLLASEAEKRLVSVGHMAPTYPAICSYTASGAKPYVPKHGDLACLRRNR